MTKIKDVIKDSLFNRSMYKNWIEKRDGGILVSEDDRVCLGSSSEIESYATYGTKIVDAPYSAAEISECLRELGSDTIHLKILKHNTIENDFLLVLSNEKFGFLICRTKEEDEEEDEIQDN